MQRAVLILFLILLPSLSAAQDFRALARALAEGSAAVTDGRDIEITLTLTQSVPFRVATYSAPMRLVIDAREVDWSELGSEFDRAEGIVSVATGRAVEAPGWSRMALALGGPFAVETAAMETDPETGEARITVRLTPTSGEQFAAEALAMPTAPRTATPAMDDRFVVALDPGHGGVDPGAEAGGLREADLMMTFARELAEALIRTGRAEVVLTRHDDVFVSLPERISVARAAGADVFLSLHADALAIGEASGATVYTLAAEASDAASASLAEQHDRTDLLQGVDLTAADDAVAELLMELTRRDTGPRAAALADQIVEDFRTADVPLHAQPRLEAGFSVLRAADIPSVLVEIGFLSTPVDRDRIVDVQWREKVQSALVLALLTWAESDAALAGLRQR